MLHIAAPNDGCQGWAVDLQHFAKTPSQAWTSCYWHPVPIVETCKELTVVLRHAMDMAVDLFATALAL